MSVAPVATPGFTPHPSHDALIVARPEGLYCPAGDFHIDPWRRVERAVITHAHADHARSGHRHYLCQRDGAGLLRARLGASISLQTLDWGERVDLGGVRLSLHPAGHVLGSAQVRLEHRGQIWVASGDYHLAGHGEANPTCAPFEPVRCHCFITESTFGLPIYRWPRPAGVFAELHAWWQAHAAQGRPCLLQAYSLGKAQRVLAGLDASLGPIVVHDTVAAINHVYAEAGVALPATRRLEDLSRSEATRAIIIAPGQAAGSPRLQALPPPATAFASGWMLPRGSGRRRGPGRGFALSDHADWPGLQAAIAATGCERVIVTHGYEDVLVRWLRGRGVDAGTLRTPYGGEERPG